MPEGKVFVDKTRKIYNNIELASDCLRAMLGEFLIAQSLDHPNIIHYEYFMRKFDPKSNYYEFHILVELQRGGDMDKYISKYGATHSRIKVKQIGGQILSALRYLHQDMQIIHKDLKPQNVLFDESHTNVKLIDLGVSNHLERTIATKAASQGTLRYMPPE